VRLEWDEQKAQANLCKHGVDFGDVEAVLEDGRAVAIATNRANERRLVAVGPYQYVRNPMISAVLTMLLGEALFLGSRVIGIWAATFFVINNIYFRFSEEPGLERRFGAGYLEYKSGVRRWVPGRKPWKNA